MNQAERQAVVTVAGPPSPPAKHASRLNTGLLAGTAEMTQNLASRTLLQATSPAQVVEFTENGYAWTLSSEHAPILRQSPINWFDLRGNADTVLVKRNSHRDVWRVTCNGTTYFAKLYHPRDPLARLKLIIRGSTAVREWQVGRYAAAHSIATVLPVAVALKGFHGAGGSSLLITAAVPDVMPLNEYWLAHRHDRRRADLITESLAMLIARAHQCGFRHGDMHPGNILVRCLGRRGEVLFVDLHNVQTGRAVSRSDVIANLAQLNQWFRRHSTRAQRRRFLAAYLAFRDRYALASPFSRNYAFQPRHLVGRLAAQAERHANRLWSKRDRRTRRTGRYFARVRPAPGWRGHVLLRSKHPAPMARASKAAYTLKQWNEWLADPVSWVDPARHTLVKDSHTATICRATVPAAAGDVTVIVKRSLARNFWKRLGLWFGPSRNVRAWRTANMLLNRDLPVAQPVAVIDRYRLGFVRVDSIILTDFIEDAVDLETFLTRDIAALPTDRQRRVKDRLVESLVGLLRTFHDRGFAHRDLKATNLLLNWPAPFDNAPRLTFIDMDGIRHLRRVRETHRTRAIVRLCASLLDSPACTRTDRLRFLKRMLTAPGRTARGWKAAWRDLDARVRGKQREKDARRAWKLKHYGRE